MVTFSSKGDWDRTIRFLNECVDLKAVRRAAEKYAQEGVAALASATPVRTGTTAGSWGYKIKQDASSLTIDFVNTNRNKNVNIAIILQYGHGTRNGGYVQGRDYINPAIQPVFDKIADEAWKEVTKL